MESNPLLQYPGSSQQTLLIRSAVCVPSENLSVCSRPSRPTDYENGMFRSWWNMHPVGPVVFSPLALWSSDSVSPW
jgi:hypothetical protein